MNTPTATPAGPRHGSGQQQADTTTSEVVVAAAGTAVAGVEGRAGGTVPRRQRARLSLRTATPGTVDITTARWGVDSTRRRKILHDDPPVTRHHRQPAHSQASNDRRRSRRSATTPADRTWRADRHAVTFVSVRLRRQHPVNQHHHQSITTLPNPLGRADTHQPVPVSSGTDALPKMTEKSWRTRTAVPHRESCSVGKTLGDQMSHRDSRQGARFSVHVDPPARGPQSQDDLERVLRRG